MIKNKKGIFILLISLIALYLIINIIYIIPKGKKYKNTVFLGSITKVSVNDGNITVFNEDKALKKQKVKIYFKKKIVDGYILSGPTDSTSVKNNYYAKDLKDNDLYFNSFLISHTPDISITFKEEKNYESNDLTVISDFAQQNGISLENLIEMDFQEIAVVDIDGDGKEESIYSVGLKENNDTDEYDEIEDDDDIDIDEEVDFSEDDDIDDDEDEEDDTEADIEEYDVEYDNTYDSLVFMKKDGKYFLIDRETDNYDGLSNGVLRFKKLIDFNNDGEYEYVIEKQVTDYGPYYYELYNFDGNKFTKIGGK